jgi:hypothetical protein
MVVGGMCNCAHEMPRYTAFKFCLDPTTEQQCALARHAGAARFAYNQCLAMVKDALDARSTGAAVDVPFTAIDLINGFNEWKKSEPPDGCSWLISKVWPKLVLPACLGAIRCASKCSRVVLLIAPSRWMPGVTPASATDVGLAFPSSSRKRAPHRRFGYAINKPRETNP